ncbi:hypothetical protein BDZ85DRAFT_258872 [Elsinoe ampelina]|uniref:Uncharacterized protein n=1 Tax=Elsinoe ampelina TaxID=302913 RepID=A0A6A6GG24_9PEZI|nr:hypothetical protein BDZ85DRAFT_258872 [Elsinoe ampelina]
MTIVLCAELCTVAAWPVGWVYLATTVSGGPFSILLSFDLVLYACHLRDCVQHIEFTCMYNARPLHIGPFLSSGCITGW